MKKISISVMGEKFEIEMEEEFFEFVKDDLLKIQNPNPKELLFFILENKKKEFENLKKLNLAMEKLNEFDD